MQQHQSSCTLAAADVDLYLRARGERRWGCKLLTDFAGQMHSVKRISLEVESLIALGLIAKRTDVAFGYFDQAIAAAKASTVIPIRTAKNP